MCSAGSAWVTRRRVTACRCAANGSWCGPAPSVCGRRMGLMWCRAPIRWWCPASSTWTPVAVIKAWQAAWRRGARITSICSGAFVLAAAGLLDGRRATTHWLSTDLLARRYPAITVDAGVLFVDEGRIVTSAGASAGLDMCLHLVRRDYGQA